MTEEAALELGAEIVANTVTFAIGIIAIIMQQSIAAATEKKREKKHEKEARKVDAQLSELESKLFEMGLMLEELDARSRELNRTIMSLPGYGKIKIKIKDSSKIHEQPPT